VQKEAVVSNQNEENKIFFANQLSHILEFKRMGMKPVEAELAFDIVLGEGPTAEDINIILEYAIKNRRLKKSDVQDKRRSAKNDDLSTDERRDRVLKLLITREIITVEKVKKPEGKDEWEASVASRNIDQPLAIVKKLLNRKASWSWPYATQIAKIENTPTNNPIVGFAQELAALDGMIPNTDLSKYTQLVEIIIQSDIELPNKACLIVLEAFLNAQQNSALLDKYKELRNKFFNKETGDIGASKELQMLNLEDFIGEKANKKSTGGTKSFTLMGINDGNPVLDNVFLSRERERSRKRIADSFSKDNPTKRRSHRTVEFKTSY